MLIGLHDADKTDFPNLALMKISAFHKLCGDAVEWFQAGKEYGRVYSSKVFTFTEEDPQLPPNAIKGGTGYDIASALPEYIEAAFPDYSLYNLDYSVGFTTRGCFRACPWCFVPLKEPGGVRPNADIEDILQPGHTRAVLMDNNPLAHEHGILQMEKIARVGIRVDYNQGLDARLIDAATARLLSKIKWAEPLRLACDHAGQIEPLRKAVELLRWYNTTPRRFFCYVLVDDVVDALERIRFLKGLDLDPFAQPFRPPDGSEPTREQRRLARWVNTRQFYKSMTWDEYQQMQGDKI